MTTQDPKYKHKPSEKHTLEEVLKSLQDLIRNDLLDNDPAAGEKSGAAPASSEDKPPREHAPPVREDFSPVNPAAGPVNLDAVMRSLKDLVSNELNVSGETEPAGESSPQTEAHATSEAFADEWVPLEEDLTTAETTAPSHAEDADAPENREENFEPLDEELTFEESMEMVPPPLSAPTMPEIPGEIFAEMLDEPEPETDISPPAPPPEAESNVAPGTQHQLLFEETPPPAAEPESLEPDVAPAPEHEPATATDVAVPEMTQETVTPELPDTSGDALPTIDVEETFDENAYFEAEARQIEASSADTRETQEIILSALGAALEPETVPATNTEEPVSTENLAPGSESDSGKTEIKLEIADEPPAENILNTPPLGFDVVEFEVPQEPPISSGATEESAPADETLAQEITLDPGPLEILSASEETILGAATEAGKNPDVDAMAPATGNPREPASSKEPAAPESFNLDDIPVLREVVAPPAGSALAGGPMSPVTEPPLPAPDRARDIVVRAVAKLNVEMRKHGGAGLDTKTILRLQQLIRRELEKDGEKS